jgi:hypothetical protein
MASARYDGEADWYDEHVAWSTAAAAPLIARLAGQGSGWCLDVGCGTGVHLAALPRWAGRWLEWMPPPTSSEWPGGGLGRQWPGSSRPTRPGCRSRPAPVRWWCRPSRTPTLRTSRAWPGRPAASWKGWPFHLCRPASVLYRPLRRAATSGWRPGCSSGICAVGLADRWPGVGRGRTDQPGRVPAPSRCRSSQRGAGGWAAALWRGGRGDEPVARMACSGGETLKSCPCRWRRSPAGPAFLTSADVVGRDGIEPPTLRFSAARSTD